MYAKNIRPEIQKIAKKYKANVKIVEVPAWIHQFINHCCRNLWFMITKEQIKVANQVQNILNNTDDVVDVDWMVRSATNRIQTRT